MFFSSSSFFFFFCSGKGWGHLSHVRLREWPLCWFVILQSICVHGIFVLIGPDIL